jgi:hypothetical protein
MASTGTNPQEGTVSIGHNSLLSLTTGAGNTAVGYQAMNDVVEGANNTVLGYGAMGGELGTIADASSNNVAIGKDALGGDWDDVRIDHAIAIGSGAMGADGLNDLDGAVAIGGQALAALTDGQRNVAVGYQAATGLTAGNNNTIIGYQAFDAAVDTESYNVAIGTYAMGACDQGSHANADVDDNVCIGYQAGLGGDFGSGNVNMINNVAIGAYAMDGTGEYECKYNTFVGDNSGGGSWTAASTGNTAIGFLAMDGAMSGATDNTSVGYDSLGALTTGDYNVAVGRGAGDTITSGTNNVFVGFHTEASAIDVTYEIVIGAGVDTSNAFAGAGTETVKIGRASDFITCDFGENATWSHSSDIRIKKDIEDSDLGLSFIKSLRPVIYKKKAPSEYPKEFTGYDENETERKNPDKKHYGFIAQEVKEAMDKAGHSEFPVWSEGKDGMQELGETELITPLIKAVQELTAKVEELEKQLKDK